MAAVRSFDVLGRVVAIDPRMRRPASDRPRLKAVERRENIDWDAPHASSTWSSWTPSKTTSSVWAASASTRRAWSLKSGELTALACGACTLGASISERVSALFAERCVSLALALDTLGNQMLIEASRLLQDHVLAFVKKRGLTMAGELRPGDPGLALEAQPAVLKLSGADRIGLGCTSGLNLAPLKSASVVYGVGRDLPEAKWSRCDACRRRENCRARA